MVVWVRQDKRCGRDDDELSSRLLAVTLPLRQLWVRWLMSVGQASTSLDKAGTCFGFEASGPRISLWWLCDNLI